AFLAARAIEQRVIVGAELTVGLGPRPVRARSASGKTQWALEERPTVALLVENHTGYRNLCRLLTRAHADLPKGESLLDPAWLSEHAAGLTAIVPAPRCPGDATTPPAELLASVHDAFGERAAIAMYRHRDGFDAARLDAVTRWSQRY